MSSAACPRCGGEQSVSALGVVICENGCHKEPSTAHRGARMKSAASTEDGPPMQEIAPGVHIAGNARRVLHSGDPKGDDLRAAEEWVRDIRSRLVRLRGELEDLGKIEARFPHDRTCGNVAGSLTLAIRSLYDLVEGERSFEVRAAMADELWEDVRANPDAYVIRDGATWDWRPLGVWKRGEGDA